jgi:hypothetical protein
MNCSSGIFTNNLQIKLREKIGLSIKEGKLAKCMGGTLRRVFLTHLRGEPTQEDELV